MKKITLLAFAVLSLSACSFSPNTGRNLAVRVGSSVQVTNLTASVLDQNTLALTGKDASFSPVIRSDDGYSSSPCQRTDRDLNIWGCKLGPIEPGKSKFVDFQGVLLSGNLFSYEKGTNRFLPTVVLTPTQ